MSRLRPPAIARPGPIADCFLNNAGFGAVVRHEAGVGGHYIGEVVR